MPYYMLDTDISSYVMKRANEQLLKKLRTVAVNDVCISVITKSELLYGVELSPRRAQDQAALKAFLNYVEVLNFPDEAADHYAKNSRGSKESRGHDRRKRSVHCCTRQEPWTNAHYEQYSRIFTGA